MGRRKKGRDISGWLIIDKPSGLTSTAVVNKVRWALDAKKAGHAGTLDPDATGILAIALGEATKTVPFVTDAMKAYEFTVRFGQATNTDDAEGEVIASSDNRPSDDDIKATLARFIGDIEQVPPKYSAVKIDGQRAYKLARDGEEITLAARPLWVEALTLNDRPDVDHAQLRIWSGPFEMEQAITLEQVERLAKTPELDAFLLPLEFGLADLPEATCPTESISRLRNGNAATVIGSGLNFGDEIWASFEGKAVAVGTYKGGELHPSRVFAKPAE